MREVRVTRYSVFRSVPRGICRVVVFATLEIEPIFGALGVTSFGILRISRFAGLYFGAKWLATDSWCREATTTDWVAAARPVFGLFPT